jgi:hypothetical protein
MRFEQALALRRLADVALQRDEALCGIPGHGGAQTHALLGRGGVAGIVDAQAPAGPGQFKGDAAAEPARGAGDQGDGHHRAALATGTLAARPGSASRAR